MSDSSTPIDGDDGRWLRAVAQDRDSAAFRSLFDRYFARVFVFIQRRVEDPELSRELTSDVFLEVWTQAGQFRGEAKISTWIFGIAHNVTCRHFRRAARTPICLEDEVLEASLRYEPAAEQQLDAARAVQRCDLSMARARGGEHAEIFHLFYSGGRPLRQIARKIGKPTQAVKDSLRRSRHMLLREVPDLAASLRAPVAS